MNVAPGASFEATQIAAGELDGILGVRIRDNQGADFLARTTAGITADTTVGSTTVYRRDFTAPIAQGQYTLIWDDGTAIVGTEELVVSRSLGTATTPSGIDLCGFSDVTGYVPGYDPEDESNETTNDLLARLITSESENIMRESGREIIPFGDQPATRSFEITPHAARAQRISVGDLSTINDSDFALELLDQNDANPATIDTASIRAIYFGRRQPIERWEPVTDLELKPGAVRLVAGRTVLVTGNWGWPIVPQFLVEATAKRVILRYLSDVAATGTAFSDAIDNANLAGLFASARDAVASVGRKVMIR